MHHVVCISGAFLNIDCGDDRVHLNRTASRDLHANYRNASDNAPEDGISFTVTGGNIANYIIFKSPTTKVNEDRFCNHGGNTDGQIDFSGTGHYMITYSVSISGTVHTAHCSITVIGESVILFAIENSDRK